MSVSNDSASQAGTAVGGTIVIVIIFALWFAVSAAVLLIGLMLKKDVKEIGPTGPLASRV
jgi:uncharacterized BrkB/YihY/UPF0761 family membrane protein